MRWKFAHQKQHGSVACLLSVRYNMMNTTPKTSSTHINVKLYNYTGNCLKTCKDALAECDDRKAAFLKFIVDF